MNLKNGMKIFIARLAMENTGQIFSIQLLAV